MTDEKKNFYEHEYKLTSYTGDVSRFGVSLPHRLLERGVDIYNKCVLEIGFNQGEHFPFVKTGWKRYVAYDFQLPRLDEKRNKFFPGVDFVHAPVDNSMPFENESFDIITITCVLHHVVELEKFLSEIKRIVKPSGVIRILLPTDPGIAYRVARTIASLTLNRRSSPELRNLNHAREHVRHFWGIRELLRAHFRESVILWRGFPFVFNVYDLNLFYIIKIVKIESARKK